MNGQAASVGSQITLGSGALLTLNADGTFAYDPNGQFDGLAQGESDTDSFTYTISDGNGGSDGATVTLTINGLTSTQGLSGDFIEGGDSTAATAIDPRRTFLRVNNDAGALPAIAIMLDTLGINPGDIVALQQVGFYDHDNDGVETPQGTLGVFSATDTLDADTVLDLSLIHI